MMRSNGEISLGLLAGLLQDLRCNMNVEIVKFSKILHKTHSSLGDFLHADPNKMISVVAQMTVTYAHFDVRCFGSSMNLKPANRNACCAKTVIYAK
jgi:hypothetical protein